jgi:hypothetical protein
LELDGLLLPYKFDISNFDHIKNDSLLEHINRAGQIFYKKLALKTEQSCQ